LYNKGNKDGVTPLHFAIQLGNEEIVKILISDKRVDINVTDQILWTPLFSAIYYDEINIVNMLLTSKADVNAVTRTYKHTPLMLASILNMSKVVQLLLDAHANVTAKDICGEQAIHHAAKEGNSEVINILINLTNTKQESGLGLNPLDCTIQRLLQPLAAHRSTSNRNTAVIDEDYLKSYQSLSHKHRTNSRIISNTDEVVRVAEALTNMVRSDKKRDKNKEIKRRSYHVSEESSSDDSFLQSNIDELEDKSSMIEFSLPLQKYQLPKFGEIDVDMKDINREESDKEKKKKKKRQKV